MPARVVVFIDYQNCYRRARDYYHEAYDPSPCGQVDPVKLAHLIVGRGIGDRALTEVRLYRGRPDSAKDPQGYGANLRQCSAWEQAGATVITRTLRYPRNWPQERPEEKGIDVALAIDFAMMAVRGEYDVGVLLSTDTDLKPALEVVVGLKGSPFPRSELAAWSPRDGQHARRLAVHPGNVWCHWLSEADYQSVRDQTDYNIAP